MDKAAKIWLCKLSFFLFNAAVYVFGGSEEIIAWRKKEHGFKKQLEELVEAEPAAKESSDGDKADGK